MLKKKLGQQQQLPVPCALNDRSPLPKDASLRADLKTLQSFYIAL
jgi:hypothetical protein